MTASILIIFLLVILNAVFAMGELALISVRMPRLAILREQGMRGADRAMRLAEDPQIFLPTVQVGMTLVSILEGTFGGVQVEAHLTPMLEKIDFLRPVAAQVSMVLVVIAITALMLVLGELVPKQLALREPEKMAARLAMPLEILAHATRPVVWVLRQSSNIVLKLMGAGDAVSQTLTEEELKAYIAEGARSGVLEHEERTMIERLLRLADRPVRAIMTPRNELYWIDRHAGRDALIKALKQTTYARLVVCEGGVDNPVGVVLAKDMLDRMLDGMPVSIEAGLRQMVVVPDSISALDMLERMRSISLGMAFVFDEYGSFEGVVTASDLFDAIVGEGGHDASQTTAAHHAPTQDDVLLMDGTDSADEVKDRLGLRSLPDEGSYHTLGGLILALLRRVPAIGDKVVYSGWLFEVLEMEGRRVSRVRASRQVLAEN
ncbi:hemolysin family protein [Acetobacter malorum]|uniref:Hemolysin C n=4 Tax=Acetobacter malorum TaxID=178901 RepID=A0A087PNW3_9PROT|nr:hemolysin family protein [Acetobacter malorum]KFL89066.1 hemolysin and related protein containing CBS domain [Acetobacter malorum]KXV06111.1 hemolysin C [Acetobacter malorum]KXV21179.1 hemolysin C [Acetobacter malorum]KXV75810.1 hemolysin C [Acetobacter malorum]GBQ83018.1 hemolysin/magnesium/cobalt transporter CorC/HlyC [Acetobacter malorum DSM 14337]